MKWFLMAVAGLHAAFTLCELFPWSYPVLLRIVSKKLPEVQGNEVDGASAAARGDHCPQRWHL
jgi:hypothetical protein